MGPLFNIRPSKGKMAIQIGNLGEYVLQNSLSKAWREFRHPRGNFVILGLWLTLKSDMVR